MRRALAATLLACAVGCTGVGPKPVVDEVRLSPATAGEAVATVVVRNVGSGDGTIGVMLTVRSRDGAVVAQKEELVRIGPNERLTLRLKLPVPEGDLEAEAEARYPVD